MNDRRVILAVAVLMIVISIIELYMGFENSFHFVVYNDYLTEAFHALLIIFGIWIIYNRKTITLKQTVALASICIGLNYMAAGPSLDYDITQILNLMMSLTIAVVGCTMFVFGILLYYEKTRNATTVSYMSLVALLILMLMFYIYYRGLIPYMSRWDFIFNVVIWNIPKVVLFFMVALILLTPGIRSPGLVTTMSRAARRVTDTRYTDEDSYIHRGGLMTMAEAMRRPVVPDDGGDPVEFETSVDLYGNQGRRMLLIRRWKGEDFLRVYVASVGGSLNGYSFKVTVILPDTGNLEDCGKVRMYGVNGFFADLLIVDPPVRYKDAVASASGA